MSHEPHLKSPPEDQPCKACDGSGEVIHMESCTVTRCDSCEGTGSGYIEFVNQREAPSVSVTFTGFPDTAARDAFQAMLERTLAAYAEGHGVTMEVEE